MAIAFDGFLSTRSEVPASMLFHTRLVELSETLTVTIGTYGLYCYGDMLIEYLLRPSQEGREKALVVSPRQYRLCSHYHSIVEHFVYELGHNCHHNLAVEFSGRHVRPRLSLRRCSAIWGMLAGPSLDHQSYQKALV